MQGPRLWHAAVELDTSQVMVVGGLVNNILAPPYVSKHHAEKVSRQQIKLSKPLLTTLKL